MLICLSSVLCRLLKLHKIAGLLTGLGLQRRDRQSLRLAIKLEVQLEEAKDAIIKSPDLRELMEGANKTD